MTKFRGPGNTWQKEKEGYRLDCWWQDGNLRDKQHIFEGYENSRSLEDTPIKELKTEEYLDKWWNSLELGNKRKRGSKKFFYWAIMDPLSKEEKAPILKDVEKCLSRKLASLKEV